MHQLATRLKPMLASAAKPVVLAFVTCLAGCQFIKNDEMNQAALAGDATRVERWLRRGSNVNGRGMHAMTPIMSAAKGGHLDLVKELVASGADPSAHNDSGSALMWAVGSGKEEVVRFLLLSGANAKWTNALGQTALEIAKQRRYEGMVKTIEARTK